MRLRILIAFIALIVAGRSNAQTISIADTTGDTICYHTSVTFTATVVGTATYGYLWKVNGATEGTSSATYTTRTLRTGVDTVYCFLTNASGDTILALSDTILMTVDSLPVIARITGLDSVCVAGSLLLSESTTGGVWSSSNTMSATVSATGTVYGIAPAAGGGGPFGGGGGGLNIDYSMANSCGSDTVRFRFTIDVPAGPIIGPDSMCMDSTTLFADTARAGIWTTSDTTIASFLNLGPGFPSIPALTANTTGIVTVYFNVANACGISADSSTLTVINCDTATAAHVPVISSLNEAVNIFPNPNTGTFSVSLSGKYAAADCVIANMVGEKVKQVTLIGGSEAELSLEGAQGIYLVTVTSGNEKYTTKVIVIQ